MIEAAPGLGILSAMITPAVLILACSSLIVATSTRLSRIMERTRSVSDEFAAIARDDTTTLVAEHRAVLFDQLNKATRRARILQRAMTCLHLALGAFVGTSVAIGIDTALERKYTFYVISLGFLGVVLLFYASVLLIVESRLTLAAIDAEMDFLRRLGDRYAPSDLLAARQRRAMYFWRPGRR